MQYTFTPAKVVSVAALGKQHKICTNICKEIENAQSCKNQLEIIGPYTKHNYKSIYQFKKLNDQNS